MRYILFVKDECPFCVKAVELLGQKEKPYSLVQFDEDQREVLKEIKEAYSWSTVPMVFFRDGQDIKFIGGYTDLQQWLESV